MHKSMYAKLDELNDRINNNMKDCAESEKLKVKTLIQELREDINFLYGRMNSIKINLKGD